MRGQRRSTENLLSPFTPQPTIKSARRSHAAISGLISFMEIWKKPLLKLLVLDDHPVPFCGRPDRAITTTPWITTKRSSSSSSKRMKTMSWTTQRHLLHPATNIALWRVAPHHALSHHVPIRSNAGKLERGFGASSPGFGRITLLWRCNIRVVGITSVCTLRLRLRHADLHNTDSASKLWREHSLHIYGPLSSFPNKVCWLRSCFVCRLRRRWQIVLDFVGSVHPYRSRVTVWLFSWLWLGPIDSGGSRMLLLGVGSMLEVGNWILWGYYWVVWVVKLLFGLEDVTDVGQITLTVLIVSVAIIVEIDIDPSVFARQILGGWMNGGRGFTSLCSSCLGNPSHFQPYSYDKQI